MKGKFLKRTILFSVIVVSILFSCKRGDRIPLDSIDVEINVKRFDKDLFSINIDSIHSEIALLEKDYNGFLKIFTNGIIGIGEPTDPRFADYLISFISDNMVSDTYLEVQKVFANTNELDKELTNAFKRYRYYFPSNQIPAVYGFISGFNNSVVIADSILAVGFDRYLGRDCEYYPRLGIHQYLQYNMHPEKISSDLIRSWGYGEFLYNDSIDNLLNNMIHEGKLMYFTKKLLPNQPDSLIFGFTPDQMKWCNRNESEMWAHLIEHKLLFNTEPFTISQFISGAPFTHGFTKESPGKAVIWLGYRIVTKFMERNKDFTLEMLMNETDYQSILNRARYKP
jgi:hypothetical protein